MPAKAVMTTPVVSVRPDTPIKEVSATLLEHGIGGAPVVEARGGLSSGEAAIRLELHGRNELPAPTSEPSWLRIVRHLREPMSLLLLAAAAVSAFALGERLDGGVILAIVLLNTTIGALQEGRAARALEALRDMQSPVTRARRDGVPRTLPAEEIVPGDIVPLGAGDRVPADLTLLEAISLELDESMLTGESIAVPKEAPGEAFSGTFVARGTAEGLVVATGRATRLGRIAELLTGRERATPLQRELAALSLRLGAIAAAVSVGFGALVLARAGFGSRGPEEAFLAAVALAVAAVPEGLATVVAVGLALGVRRMAAEGAIVRRLPAVETLGSTRVILTDKTGTLTENRMRVESILLPGGEQVPLDDVPERVARALALCNDAELDPPSGDPLEVALLAPLSPEAVAGVRRRYPRRAAAPFDTASRTMATLHEGGLLVVKGAPEELLARADRRHDPGGDRELGEGERERLRAITAEAAARGARTLALAERTDADELGIEGLTLLALVALRDPVRAEAPAAVAEARRAGVRLVMVTGDHAGTARHIAGRVGIDDPPGEPITGAELDGSVPEDPLEHAVYARVSPEQKLSLVDRLHERGEVVAVTGDGVNDAPALRRADIGVAMGRSGSDVAREAADMVVTDDNLATIVTAVREGRAIYDNLRKVVDYLVGGNLSEMAVVVGALLLFPSLGVPLLPLQLLWVNLLTDGLPALALGVDRADPRIMARPPRAPGTRMLPARRIGLLAARGGLLAASSLGALAFSRFVLTGPWPRARTVMFSVLVVAHLLYALVVRRPGTPTNRWLLAAIGVGIALQVAIVAWPAAHAVFDTTSLGVREWLLVAAGGVAPAAVMGLIRRRPAGPWPASRMGEDG